jgi:hypothetical protein
VFGVHISLAGSLGNLTVSQLAVEVIAQVGQDSTGEADVATAIVERHVGKIDTAHVDVVKQALREDIQRFNGLAS